MANKEQLEILKSGVQAWNQWRGANPKIEIDLEKAELSSAKLQRANLSRINLSQAMFIKADLHGTDLTGSNLFKADFTMANLRNASLYSTNLSYSTLYHSLLGGCDLVGANLRGADLSDAELDEARLIYADLFRANITRASLKKANLEKAILGQTILNGLDLSEIQGLDEVTYRSPSYISSETFQFSKGKIPLAFLRGCGLNDWEIESAKLYQPGLSPDEIDKILYRVHDLRVGQGVQINPLFISYNHRDGAFVDVMEKQLNEKGIRFWRDIHEAIAGRLEKVVDRAMRMNPTVLLVLSENSVKSDWVEHEARTARELEKELGRDVLCPVALDDAWKDCKWPARLREQIMEYNILDFSKWQDEAEFERMFRRMIDGIDLFYQEGEIWDGK